MANSIIDPDAGGQGYVSIWLNLWFEVSNSVIGWYDSDYSEGFSTNHDEKIADILDHLNLNEKTIKEIDEVVNRLNVKSIEYCWMLRHHKCVNTIGELKLAKNANGVNLVNEKKTNIPYFIGTYPLK